ncbi:MAG TPA: hypothetical protein VKS80_08730 [Trinickia sp.]|nr:hypothetical protein [Trinickia sp.]
MSPAMAGSEATTEAATSVIPTIFFNIWFTRGFEIAGASVAVDMKVICKNV